MHEPTIARFVVGLVVGVWWLAGLRFPSLFFRTRRRRPRLGTRYGPHVSGAGRRAIDDVRRAVHEVFWPDRSGLFRVTRLVWLTTGIALIALVASSDHQWMVWRPEAAARGQAFVFRFAGRDISLIEFLNLIWSIVFIVVAALSVWGVLKAVLRRFRGPLMTAHA